MSGKVEKTCLTCWFTNHTDYGPYCTKYKCMKELEYSCDQWAPILYIEEEKKPNYFFLEGPDLDLFPPHEYE